MQPPTSPLMSIGALSRATGVPADTLRTWERRYGFPSPERTDSGHRRYSLRTLERLRLVTQALQLGHRPASVLGADEGILRELLDAAAPGGTPVTPQEASAARDDDREVVQRCLQHVARFDGQALERELQGAWARRSPLSFMDECVGPFLQQLGERWEAGQLGVRHEHFASERLREFLTSKWRPVSDAASGTPVVLATLPGEQHVLGLHMAALALALQNRRIVLLGANSPPSEIARAVEHHAADAVVLSAAAGCGRAELMASLRELQSALPRGVRVLVGGAGFEPKPADAEQPGTLQALANWAAERG